MRTGEQLSETHKENVILEVSDNELHGGKKRKRKRKRKRKKKK